MDKIKIGKLGEDCAEQFLISQNYHIVKRNYRIRSGEIDIIAVDHNQNGQTVFVEVKTRTTEDFGSPEDAIDHRKKIKILQTALHFLSSASQKSASSWRIDLIAVKLDSKYRLKDIRHLKNIFDG